MHNCKIVLTYMSKFGLESVLTVYWHQQLFVMEFGLSCYRKDSLSQTKKIIEKSRLL
jgi:hypothetical protein